MREALRSVAWRQPPGFRPVPTGLLPGKETAITSNGSTSLPPTLPVDGRELTEPELAADGAGEVLGGDYVGESGNQFLQFPA